MGQNCDCDQQPIPDYCKCYCNRVENPYSAVDCACSDASTNCELLPDLVVSGNATFTENYETDGQLHIRTIVGNIGYGPFTVYNTGETQNVGGVLKKVAYQTVYHKNGDAMTYENQQDPIYMEYHAGHGHLHLENWVEMTLRIKDPNIPNPLDWEQIGISKKLSFRIENNADCVNRDFCNDISWQENMTELNNNINFWQTNNSALEAYLKDNFTDFPNFKIGGTTQELQTILPGTFNLAELDNRLDFIQPGAADRYSADIVGKLYSIT